MRRALLNVAILLPTLLVFSEVSSQRADDAIAVAPSGLGLSGLTDNGVWELRIYTINRGRLDDFVAAWSDGVYPLRLEHGFKIPAAWVDRENNQFIWVLGYDGPLEWEEAQEKYYGSNARQSLANDPVDFIASTENRRIAPAESGE